MARLPQRLPQYGLGRTGILDVAHWEDNEHFYFGTGNDTNMYFDGTRFIMDCAGLISIGGGAGSHALGADGLYVKGKLEVDDRAYFDNFTYFYSESVYDSATGTKISFRESNAVRSYIMSVFGTDQLIWTLSAGVGRQLILGNSHDQDYDHAVQTNPTYYIHSVIDPNDNNTQWISFAHNQVDPIFQLGTGNFKFLYSDGEGAFWNDDHIDASKVDPGGSGAVLGVTNAILHYQLDAITEYIYFGYHVDDDWDGNSDIIVKVYVCLDALENGNDLIRASLMANYYGDHEDIDTAKTQTRSIDHNITGDISAGDVHELIFVIDHDLAGNLVQAGDVMNFRFWLDDVTTAPVVAAVRFLHADVFYRSKEPRIGYPGSMPTEG